MAVENIGGVYNVKIPGLTDAADIQAAFQAYHYGAYTSTATTAGIAADSMAYWLKTIEADIATLEARPSSGGDVANTAPVAGDFTPSGVPNGYIWVDQDGAMTSNVIGATAIYNNNAPTSNLTAGLIWIDKDATTSTTENPFIPQSIIAAKGDLIAGNANDSVVVLTVGSNGQYLKADSSTTSGLAWSDPGDLTAVSAGTGITVTSGTGPIPSIAIDTATTVDLSTAQTLTNKTLTSPTISGGTSTTITQAYPVLIAPEERMNIVASAATGTINIDVATSSIWYYTSNAGANHTLNFRFSSSTSLNSILTTGDVLTVSWLNTNGATAYYPNLILVDSATSGVTTNWSGGTAPSAGNASAIDAYSFTIVKTANATFRVLAAGAVKYS